MNMTDSVEACEDCEKPGKGEAPATEEPRHSLRGLAKEILGVFFSPSHAQAVEREMLKLSAFSFLVLLALTLIGFYGFFRGDALVLRTFGIPVVSLLVGLVANTATLWHVRAYKNISCST